MYIRYGLVPHSTTQVRAHRDDYQGPVVQNFVTLPSLLDSLGKGRLHKEIHFYFLLIKCENPLHGKGFSHFINKK